MVRNTERLKQPSVRGTMVPLAMALAFATAPGCAEQPEVATDPMVAVIETRVADYYRDMSARNWGTYREYFWPGATLTTVWQPPGTPAPAVVPTTIEDFIAQTHLGPDSKPIFEERLLRQQVRVRGDVAQVIADYEVRFGEPGSVMTWRGVDAFTWLRHRDEWRISALTYVDAPEEE